MPLRPAILAVAAIAVLAIGLEPVIAQQLVPVDQAVGDLDRLSKSMRRVEVGLRDNGEQTSLFQLQPNSLTPQSFNPTPVYYRIGPGFRAQVDRLDYLIPLTRKTFVMDIAPRHDGQFLELIPANTVFDLRPTPFLTQPLRPNPPLAEAPADGRPTPLNLRVDRATGVPDNGQYSRYRVEPLRINNRIEPVRAGLPAQAGTP